MLRLEPRAQTSNAWRYASPVLALFITVVIGVLLFALLGKDPIKGLLVFFWEPIKSAYAWSELLVKATPLLIIALGLSVCFRANVWNIGAEGQFVMGAIFASGMALMANAQSPAGFWMLAVLAGVVGGMFWAGVTAWLRDRFNANEILVSLMLVYVAIMVLNYLVYGPWKDPKGYNFPQSQAFEAVAQIPRGFKGWWPRSGWALAPAHALCARGLWLCRHHRGVCGALASGGHGVLGFVVEHVLHWGRIGPVALGLAAFAHRGVPRFVAVCIAGLRHPDELPAPLGACPS